MSAPLLVADSGPLIALARLDLLRLPAALFRQALVPTTVWHEVTREPRAAELSALERAQRAGMLQVLPDPPEDPAFDARLDAGERMAIALAQTSGAVVLVDDKRARAAARAAGLDIVGTLGLLVRARDAGLVAQVRPLTHQLAQSGYFLAPALVARTLACIGEDVP